MIYYFIHCKKVGFYCESYHFLPYDDVGKFLFENQGLNGYDRIEVYRVERRNIGGTFTIYLFNQYVFPPKEELLKAMSAFLNVSSEDIPLRFYSDKVEHY